MEQTEMLIFMVAVAAARQGRMPLHQALRGTRATAPDLTDASAEDLARWVDVAAKTIM